MSQQDFKRVAKWFYWAFMAGILKCPVGRDAGFVYDIERETDRIVLRNVMKMAKGDKLEEAQELLSEVFSIY